MTTKDDILAFLNATDKATIKAKDIKAQFPAFTAGMIAGAVRYLTLKGKIKKISIGSYVVVNDGTPAQ